MTNQLGTVGFGQSFEKAHVFPYYPDRSFGEWGMPEAVSPLLFEKGKHRS
ncbi:MAG TPA: hypothetical protein VGM62_04020 [Chthoniobacterales bacterium]